MSNVTATSRRVVRTLAHRNIDWSRNVWKLTPRTAAKVNSFRAWVTTGEVMADKYNKPPAPVDFSGAKSSIRDQELIAGLEDFYKTASPAPETYEPEPGVEEERKKVLAMFEESEAFDQELKESVKAELDFMKDNRTTKDTTIFDFKMNYPGIHEQIEDEIENREWFKDVGMTAK
ncbi:ATP synthase D chain, mitochondrial (ATP5H) [Seminavis robusta]|uniref:ATP synthase D chain, mitochondrial (ATP5H) n=1 Tax=Seminavis robusta TaxID=568900 RepID=A0A9N8DDZ4_9STRA|nr:ATP synthase D chain, mitochondrial (ATP5H) [Seminavis robusta]|eukprot:Sro98_g050460.1 ATP synthase D chain, mitochondrial (ATP5H) (175) ;mRNA; r:56549-57369